MNPQKPRKTPFKKRAKAAASKPVKKKSSRRKASPALALTCYMSTPHHITIPKTAENLKILQRLGWPMAY